MSPEIDAFHAALELPAHERESFVKQRHGDDPALVERLLRLLKAHAEVERHGLAREEALTQTEETTRLPASIGPYRIQGRIGAGGMGVVYEAEQTEPLQRRVALKVLKRGMDTDELLVRFEAERQALALMEHPGIARILDAGASEDGRPYFVMELVEGLNLTDYCSKEALPLREVLELFNLVCGAVHHAHQRGIVHRDLKPSNILIASADGSPRPKVIDFGIAKAIQATLTDRSFTTRDGSIIGTPEYMSPEQARGLGGLVDTRCDVYSLGVILYELVTGTLPFDVQSVLSRGAAGSPNDPALLDPTRPSTRLRSLQARDERTAMDHQARARQVRGDLDSIILKALASEPEGRYLSAASLASDLQRFLDHRPVEARAPSAGYLMQRFIRRHRVVTSLIGVVGVSMLVGIGGLTTGLVRASRAEAIASKRAEAAQASADFLQKVLFQVDPEFGRASLTIADVLENAGSWIGDELADFPAVEASTRESIGVTFRRRSKFAAAEEHLERSLALRLEHLGSNSPETASAHVALAALRLEWDGALDEALTHLAEARRILVDNGLDGARAIAWIDLDVGLANLVADRLGEAEAAFERCKSVLVRDLGESHPDVSRPLRGLAEIALIRGDVERAADLSHEAVNAASGLDVGYLLARAQLVRATVLAEEGRTRPATFQLAIAKTTLDRRVGDQHIRTAEFHAAMARVHLAAERFEPAYEEAAKCESLRVTLVAPAHWSILEARLLRAKAALGLGQLDEVRSLLEGAHGEFGANLPAGHRLLVEATGLLSAADSR